jgi:hypothetical protein
MKITEKKLRQIIRQELKEGIGGTKPVEYSDTAKGAKQLLKDMSNLDHAKIDAARCRPDPHNRGVWLVANCADEIDGPDAVVYTAEGDFEMGRVRRDDVGNGERNRPF